tara:strand:- start:1866 stop:2183 length:318 start_codon:yes stop_codon:yes gene_type:complete
MIENVIMFYYSIASISVLLLLYDNCKDNIHTLKNKLVCKLNSGYNIINTEDLDEHNLLDDDLLNDSYIQMEDMITDNNIDGNDSNINNNSNNNIKKNEKVVLEFE